jgi:hypothetical protein
MQSEVPAGSIVLGGRSVFPSTADAEIWFIRADEAIAQRPSAFERRVFRDPHPLDDQPALFDNGNGFRFLIGALGVKAIAGDNTLLLPPAGTFDTTTSSVAGGVYFSFNKYQVMVTEAPGFADGVDPASNAPPAAFDRGLAYATATYNVENLYDRRNDPNDGCDFTGDPGCPGVNPPFDYVPASQEIYDGHLDDIAQQVVEDLHAPDLILVQEAEDQDICAVVSGALDCGSVDDRDGKPDTLQELALRIASFDGPPYDAAFDRDGADDRGIVSGFLYRTDRVELLPASAGDTVLGSDPAVEYRGAPLASNTDVSNPKTLNADLPADVDLSTGVDGSNVFTRAPQVGQFRIWRDGIGSSTFTDLWAISNHFSSTPNARVGQRREQAAYDAAIVEAIASADPAARVVVGGDFNVFPRPDDPFSPGHPRFPSDQLGPLYAAGLTNLWDHLVDDVPASAYGYVFEGQAQTLDQQFLSPALDPDLETFRIAHVNADWPADHFGDTARGASDHDPGVAVLDASPTVERLEGLVEFYASGDDIAASRVGKLLDRLAKAARFRDDGRTSAYLSQLEAFVSQTSDWTPRFIRPAASAALQGEASLLIDLGG